MERERKRFFTLSGFSTASSMGLNKFWLTWTGRAGHSLPEMGVYSKVNPKISLACFSKSPHHPIMGTGTCPAANWLQINEKRAPGRKRKETAQGMNHEHKTEQPRQGLYAILLYQFPALRSPTLLSWTLCWSMYCRSESDLFVSPVHHSPATISTFLVPPIISSHKDVIYLWSALRLAIKQSRYSA